MWIEESSDYLIEILPMTLISHVALDKLFQESLPFFFFLKHDIVEVIVFTSMTVHCVYLRM